MSDMGPSLRDLAKFAGLAVGFSKQTLVDDLVQFLCTHRVDTAADAFLAALQAKLAEQPGRCSRRLLPSGATKVEGHAGQTVAAQVKFLSLD